jgi:polyhydroxybutyrate depolymerase
LIGAQSCNQKSEDETISFILIRMLKTILISLVAFCIATGLHAQMDSVFFDGAYRHYALHFPPQYDGSTPLPLVICLHGGFGSGLQFEEQSTLSEKSDEAGFVAVYPNGTGYLLAPNLRFWNAGNCCGYAEEQNIDDVGFIEAMIDALVADYAIDATRVYSTGISNGAFMSYRLACELSDKIAAIAPVAGGMLVDECLPSSSVPIIHFQSFLDTSNPYTGGVGDGVGTHDNPPLDSVFTVWANTNLCTNLADTISVSEEYTHVRWNNCEWRTFVARRNLSSFW